MQARGGTGWEEEGPRVRASQGSLSLEGGAALGCRDLDALHSKSRWTWKGVFMKRRARPDKRCLRDGGESDAPRRMGEH